MPTVPGLGDVGVWGDYEDWRDVGGVKLPFHIESEFATPLLGTYDSRYEQVETNVEAGAGAFELEEAK